DGQPVALHLPGAGRRAGPAHPSRRARRVQDRRPAGDAKLSPVAEEGRPLAATAAAEPEQQQAEGPRRGAAGHRAGQRGVVGRAWLPGVELDVDRGLDAVGAGADLAELLLGVVLVDKDVAGLDERAV